MSKLVHLCTKCGHSEQWHAKRTAAYTQCACCRSDATQENLDPTPVLRETYSLATGSVEPLAQPGSTWNAGTSHREALCACEACREAYRSATA